MMPCYNSAATLEECLASIAAQTFTDYEFVIVDDGSDDATPKILAAHAQRDPRLRVIRQAHGGIVRALQAGLSACLGDYVARMDADDLAAPARLAKQTAFLDAQPDVDVVSCLVNGYPEADVRGGFRVYLEWLNGLVSHEAIVREIFVESPLPHPSVMFRRQSVLQAGGYEERGWPEDYDLWLRMYIAGARFGKVPEVLLDWREHPDRLTRTDSRYSLENFLRTKAHYLLQGPLQGRDAVIIWGAGMMGRRLSKHLIRGGAPITAFVDIDPKKIGRTRRDRPIIAPEGLADAISSVRAPIILAAVGARGARILIRERLIEAGYLEGTDWLAAA
jgi:glycosyltransferase involved in cell wall biosynthesis